MDLLPAGAYLAKVIDYGVVETKAGSPMVVAKFAVKDKDAQVFWNGVLKPAEDGKRNIPIEALIVMGLNSINDIEKLADGPSGGALNLDEEVNITVVHEDYNGKTRAKVQWVNKAGGSGFKSQMSRADFKAKLGGIANLKADFAVAYQQAGGKKKDMDIPF